MSALYFSKRELLVRTLAIGMIPAAIAESPVQFAIDDVGGYWIQPSVALAKSVSSALGKLGIEIRPRSPVAMNKSANCWAEMLPVHVNMERPVDRALLEWTDLEQIPAWASLVRRLGGSIIALRQEPRRAWAVVAAVPFHALAQPLPTGWSAFVEQSPGFWVEHGYQHPLPTTGNKQAHVVVRHGQPWEVIQPIEAARPPARFSVPKRHGESLPSVDIRIPVIPRLVADARSPTPTLWILPVDGDANLRVWLQHADDRFVRQLQVGRIATPAGGATVLMTLSDSACGSLVMPNAQGYYSYLKLNNLFVPAGRRMTPGLRRDVARRTYAPRTDLLVWLDDDGSGGLISSALPFSAFRPLSEMVRYHVVTPANLAVVEPRPLFPVPPLVIKDRPAPKIRPKLVAPIDSQTPTEAEPPSGIINALIAWVKGAWQVTATTPPVSPLAAGVVTPEAPRLSTQAETPISRWHEQSEQVRSMIHQSQRPPTDMLAALAQTAMREGRLTEAIWCWQQILWSGESTQVAATGWEQSENLQAGGPRIAESLTPGQIAAAIVRSALSDQTAPLPIDDALNRLAEHENDLPIKAVWMAHRALARRAGNDVLTLARVRDRLLNRLLHHGINLELDVPAFLRADDAQRSDRVTVVRAWLERLPEALNRWLGDRPPTSDQLEMFGLARERINTIEYAHVITAWGMAAIGAPATAHKLADPALKRLDANGPVHGWLADVWRYRMQNADRIHRWVTRWPENLQERWRQLTLDQRFAVDRMQQASRILDPLGIIDPFAVAQNGLDDPLVQLLLASVAEMPRAVEVILRRTRPTPAARLPVLTRALKLASPAGESLVRSLIEQLLLELEPFTAVPVQWHGMQAGLSAAAQLQDRTLVQRLVNLWLGWLRDADQLSAGLDELVACAIPALRRVGMDAVLDDIIAETQRLLVAPAHEVRPTLMIDQTHLAVAGGLFAMGSDDAALRILDNSRRLLFTQGEYEARDRSVLALKYVQSLRYASARVTIGRFDEFLQRFPAPADRFSTNAYFALAPLQIIDAMVRTAANEDLELGTKVRRWLDADELAIRRRIVTDVAELMRDGP